MKEIWVGVSFRHFPKGSSPERVLLYAFLRIVVGMVHDAGNIKIEVFPFSHSTNGEKVCVHVFFFFIFWFPKRE